MEINSAQINPFRNNKKIAEDVRHPGRKISQSQILKSRICRRQRHGEITTGEPHKRKLNDAQSNNTENNSAENHSGKLPPACAGKLHA
ncbi:hypothetical protein [Methanoplanus endosymbiosus]|uniref:Uncharacterized protein n=1 Tax=Methanoplanus endosymbiosus TaxID=33865 RepID=A0A9E7PML1_9EURY|nr:hypothetical protein [Methanoplanus endosymbiosus]UUX91719.1 hypothetical protein L6E24_10135 [Methanoplanus endosymbiosus]